MLMIMPPKPNTMAPPRYIVDALMPWPLRMSMIVGNTPTTAKPMAARIRPYWESFSLSAGMSVMTEVIDHMLTS